MSNAVVTLAIPETTEREGRLALPVAVGLGAFIWFVLLSGWLGVKPGTVITARQNVLFNSDTALWIARMAGAPRLHMEAAHPLETAMWRPPIRALGHLLSTFLPADYAGVLAARLWVALIAGLGVGFLALLAVRLGIKPTECALLFIMYFLFTQSSTVCLPEHFGVSNGLLTITFVAPLLTASLAARMVMLGGFAVLNGGTTCTNILFPLGSAVHYYFKSVRVKLALLAAAIPCVVVAGYVFFRRSWSAHALWIGHYNVKVVHHPWLAIPYTIYALVCPAIGPVPEVLRWPGWDMVSYEPAMEPVHLSAYLGLPAVGALAWVVLLVLCVSRAVRDARTRPAVWLLLGWVLFNVIFHNMWGDELMLYSPHWSWALMALVVLGARHLPRRWLVALVLPLMVSQVYTLLAIRSALQTIVR